MARYTCVRCSIVLQHTDPPHLCRDVAARLHEAERRASVPCQGRERMADWLTRMAHYDPGGKPPLGHEWRIDHHGHWHDVCHPRA